MYEVIGPDDYPIAPVLYESEAEATAAISAFAERFREQGYYSGVSGRIPLDAIADACLVMEVEADEEWEDDGESFPE